MKRSTILHVLLALSCAGCTTKVSTVGNLVVEWPRTGVWLVYAPNGRLLQKSVLRDGIVVAVWEYHRGGTRPGTVVDAHGWEDARLPSPRWTQTVVRGNGIMSSFDERGLVQGWGEYRDGIFVRGVH